MLCLEGGYHSSQTVKSVEACLRSLLDPPPLSAQETSSEGGAKGEGDGEEVASEIKAVVSQVKQTLAPHWSFS
jgi:hypothetical protein